MKKNNFNLCSRNVYKLNGYKDEGSSKKVRRGG